ncbi:MAG: dephospho-CoA kinase [Clostridia bacterium]|nr:dephospho-CoA kinase [Clostridia bacterium]
MLICITGLTGSGKTTALQYIASKGYETFEVDKYIHSIYNKGDKGYEVIRDTFGPQYVNDNGVDRQKLGQLVFNNKDELNKLNNLMLPFIKQKLRELKKEDKLIFVEMAIYLNYAEYFENTFDNVIIIKGKEEIQNQKLNDLN